jgi:hypothetical protein
VLQHEDILGSEGIVPSFLTSALDRGERSVSHPGRFTSRERLPGANWIEDWVGPRAWLNAPSRNVWNMTPDLRGYAGQCKLGSLALRPLSHARLVYLPFPSDMILYRLWPAICSPFSTDPSPLHCIDFPCGPLSLSSCSYIASCFRLVAQSAASCSHWFLARRFFCPENGGDTFLRNVGSHKIYTRAHLRRRHSS